MFQVNGHVNVIAQPLPTKYITSSLTPELHVTVSSLACRELAVSLEIEKAIGQLFLHGDKVCIFLYEYCDDMSVLLSLPHSPPFLPSFLPPSLPSSLHLSFLPPFIPPSLPTLLQPCPTTEDGMYPLAELSLSSKVLLFLNPLNTRGRVLNSVQINTAPLSLTLMQEGRTRQTITFQKILFFQECIRTGG